MATKVNIFADQGSDYNLDLTVKDDDGSVTDLSTFSANASFKKSYGTSQTHIFTTQILDATAGRIQLKLPAELSSNVAHGRYVYDMTIDSPTLDSTRRIIEGVLTIRPKV